MSPICSNISVVLIHILVGRMSSKNGPLATGFTVEQLGKGHCESKSVNRIEYRQIHLT